MTDPLAPAALDGWERLAITDWKYLTVLADGPGEIEIDDRVTLREIAERILGLIAAAQKGAEDSARLDHLDSLPSGITINSDARFPSCSMTPKEGGSSHTRKLIDMDRTARRVSAAAPEERDDA